MASSSRFLLLLLLPFAALAAPVEEGFVPLFNGRDLSGWEGDPKRWTVEEGVVIGRSRADDPLKTNTFLVWKGGEVRNFELRLSFRFPPSADGKRTANSGVQYRSRVLDPAIWSVGGYQADMDAAGRYVGMLYEERGRGIVCRPGEQVRLDTGPDGKVRSVVLGATASAEALASAYRPGEWNDLVIIARGRNLTHRINGVTTSEVRDDDEARGAEAGVLALQLHVGPPMEVQFRDVRMRVIARGEGAAAGPRPPDPLEGSALKVAPGFKVERLYTVPRDTQGSWVCLTVDPQGRLIAGDQYGDLYRIRVAGLPAATPVEVEPLRTGLTGAHGVLYAHGSLYVMINEEEPAGLWRLRDLDGKGRFGPPELLRVMNGSGEHGTHALVLGPDGRSIYFANGNHTDLPLFFERTRPIAWGEDHVITRLWDARGHAKDVYAPGGYIGRTDPDGREVEIVSIGYRNQYDLAFDANGEAFTYDSDMEWDIGMPWYVPTRVNHVVSGSDFGWRSGAGRWPEYYADSLGAVADLGPGSPTGTAFGTGARFPAEYQRALFLADWTYGTLYALHLTADGSSFRGRAEEFVAGKPLPLTDLLVNPADGAMYFTTGGRRTQSALYRVTYSGSADTRPAGIPPPTPEARLRRELETLHETSAGPETVARVWPHLGHADRGVRFAARVALERQPWAAWADRALAEADPARATEALIALARVGPATLQPRLLAALERIEPAGVEGRLAWVRAWQLGITRLGEPAAELQRRAEARLLPLYPSGDDRVDRELVALLVRLGSEGVVARAVPRLGIAEVVPAETVSAELIARNDHYAGQVRAARDSRPDRQQIALAYALREARAGWTPKLRAEYFSWFARTRPWRGGMSFTGFLQMIRDDALAMVPDPAEKAAMASLSARPPPTFPIPEISPAGPGRAYTVAEAASLIPAEQRGRNFARGRAMFTATACIVCHRFGAEGSGIGPDLTGAGNRYSVRDLLENILEPSAVISDQYGSEQFTLADGSVVVGRVVSEDAAQYRVLANPFLPDETIGVRKDRVRSRQPYPLSMMPAGLVNGLNPEELQDLVAYLLSGGNPDDPRFR